MFKPFEELEGGERAVDRVDLEFVGEVEERLDDASSNVGKGEKDVGGMVSCGSCDRAVFVDSDGESGVLRVVKEEK